MHLSNPMILRQRLRIVTWLLDQSEAIVSNILIISIAMVPFGILPVNATYNSSDSTQEITGATLNNDFVLEIERIPCEYAITNPFTFNVVSDYGVEGLKNFLINMTLTNIKPIINETVLDQSTTANDSDIIYDAQYLFRDLFNNPLTWQATLEDGSPLPSWILFDEITKIFTIKASEMNEANVSVTAITFEGIPKSQIFNALITNTPPSVIDSFTNVTIIEKVEFDETIGDVSPKFSVESDPNQYLTFSVSSEPCWVNMEWTGNSLRIYGIAPYQGIDSRVITIRASDGFEYAETNITLIVNENLGPVPDERMSTSYDILE